MVDALRDSSLLIYRDAASRLEPLAWNSRFRDP
jgi:hypothetical protein